MSIIIIHHLILEAVEFTSNSDGLGCRHNSYKHIKEATLEQTQGEKEVSNRLQTKTQKEQISFRKTHDVRNMYSQRAKLYKNKNRTGFCCVGEGHLQRETAKQKTQCLLQLDGGVVFY